MKLNEQLDQLRHLEYRYRTALTSAVTGHVEWVGGNGRMVSTVGGMPKRNIRLGLTVGADPLVIVHYVDTSEVVVVTPDKAAQWPWPMVDAFGPSLREFLLRNAFLERVNPHTPSEAWVRREVQALKTRIGGE